MGEGWSILAGEEDGGEKDISMICLAGEVRQEGSDGAQSIMIDSGSDCDCCPPWFASACPLLKTHDKLEDVHEGGIKVYGKRHIGLLTKTNTETLAPLFVTFTVSDVRGPLFSGGKMIRRGVQLDTSNINDLKATLESHTMQMHLERGSLFATALWDGTPEKLRSLLQVSQVCTTRREDAEDADKNPSTQSRRKIF